MGEIIHLNEEEVKSQLSEMVRESVEKTLNQLLDAEADEITQAHRYERTEDRVDTRAGHYHRKLVTRAGTVDIKVALLRQCLDNFAYHSLCGSTLFTRCFFQKSAFREFQEALYCPYGHLYP